MEKNKPTSKVTAERKSTRVGMQIKPLRSDPIEDGGGAFTITIVLTVCA